MKIKTINQNPLVSNFKKRFLTSCVLGSITIWVTWIGGLLFSSFCVFLGGLIIYEWNNLIKDFYKNVLIKYFIWIFYFFFAMVLLNSNSTYTIIFSFFCGCLLISFLVNLSTFWIFGGFLYAGILSTTLILLRTKGEMGFFSVIFLYFVVWGTDVGSYCFGKFIGGPKIFPKISPKKTWSGSIGGTIVGTFCGIIAIFYFVPSQISIIFIFIISLFLSIISQIGDLVESKIKRCLYVKNSGKLLPGHGGIIDRIDSLVFASLFLYLIGSFISGIDHSSEIFSVCRKHF